MAAPSKNGTRYLGMSPRGGIAKPPWVELTACRQCCQLARLLFPTGGLRNPVFGPSLVGIGDKAGSPSDGPSVQALRTLDVSRIAHGWERADIFLSPQISSDRF